MASSVHALERDLARRMGRCIADFGLIEDGDRVMVCVSGGKDSYGLLHLLARAQRRAPVRFELIAVHLDQGHPGYDGRPLERWLHAEGHTYRILREDTHSIVTERIPAGKTFCSLCSRLRRGILYNAAEELGCTKIALGHHRDDAVETLLLNLMFAGSMGAMPPKWVTRDGRNTVIRPLLYCPEATLAELAEALAFPILPCDLCGSQDNLWRQQVKALLTDLEQRVPNVRDSMLAAMAHVRPSHLLDASLWKALGVPAAAEAEDDPAGPDAPTAGALPRKSLPLIS